LVPAIVAAVFEVTVVAAPVTVTAPVVVPEAPETTVELANTCEPGSLNRILYEAGKTFANE
jgi:hypothetical protein